MSFFLFALVLFIYHLKISARIDQLEKRIEDLKGASFISVGEVQKEANDTVSVVPPSNTLYPPGTFSPIPAAYQHSPVSSVGTTENPFYDWLKQDFLVKLGGLLLLIAFGWIVSYAFANNWIGPMGRIMLGLLTGVVFMVVGVLRFSKSASQGSIFVIIGSSLILLTVAAAREIYGFFTPYSALLIMFMTVVFVAFMSVRFKRQSLSVAGLVMGGIAPMLTANLNPSMVALSLYLLVLVAGTLWVVYLTRSTLLTPIALGVVGVLNLLYINLSFEDQLKGLLFAFVFTTIFFLGNIFSLLHRTQAEFKTSHLLTAFGTAVYLLVWIMAAAPETWQTILYIVWMLVFASGAFAVYQATSERGAFYIYSAVAFGLLGAATVNEFSGPLLTIVLTLEIAGLLLVANRLLRQTKISETISLLLFIPSVLSVEHIISSSWNTGIMHGDFIALLVIMNVFLIIGATFNETVTEGEEGVPLKTAAIIIGSVYGLLLIWLITHALLLSDTATTVSLIIYTIIGLCLYVVGKLDEKKILTISGGILLGGVIARLLLIEVWDMALSLRIITFIVIGILLLSTAFIKKEKKSTDNLIA